MFIWSERSATNLEGIHPELLKVCNKALQITEQDFTVIEGLRSLERQKQLVRDGFSKTMNSRHLTGHAVDIVPFPIAHRLEYPHEKWVKVAQAMLTAGRQLGVDVEWGYNKWGWDKPHYQLSWKSYPA